MPLINQGKDTTLEPAYFARRNKQSSGSDADLTEVNKKISDLTKRVNNLDKDSKEYKEAVDNLAEELNKLFE